MRFYSLWSLLVVARILPYYILLAAVAVSVFLSDRKVLGQVDYCLIFYVYRFSLFLQEISDGCRRFRKYCIHWLTEGNFWWELPQAR